MKIVRMCGNDAYVGYKAKCTTARDSCTLLHFANQLVSGDGMNRANFSRILEILHEFFTTSKNCARILPEFFKFDTNFSRRGSAKAKYPGSK